jgi:hypothetical protein
MKSLVITTFVALLSVSTVACSKEKVVEDKPAVVNMEPQLKTICRDRIGKDGKVVIGKDGKAIQDCKTIKVRPKLEGTTVPPEKKK